MLPRSIAKIVLPTQSKGNNDTNNKRLIQLQSIKEFERIHTLFMR
jgi:hypothetical protein